MREITVDQFVKLNNAVSVDVRSPGEFKEFHIPGAVNIPLFTDEERVIIGTIYKQDGADVAKWKAMELVSPKIPLILRDIKAIHEKGSEPIIYCWRGGMRSKAVATFIAFAGISIPRLIGGYRAYRQYILGEIPAMLPDKAITLHGMTGVGKTDVLKGLYNKGLPVIDLEGLAGHRGSIFGTFGLFPGNNQKTFDSLLYKSLTEMIDSPFFIIEAESKRIGKVVLPDELLKKKQHGTNFHLHASMTSRVERIYNDYCLPYVHEGWFHEKVVERLSFIKKRIKSHEIIASLNEAASIREYKTVIQILLEDYYDPRYAHKQMEYSEPFHHIDAENTESAVMEIMQLFHKKNALAN